MVGRASNRRLKTFDELSIELTHKCNLNCVFCSSKGGSDRSTFIDIYRIKEVVNESINKFDLDRVSLSGGEPFLHDGFLDLYDFLENKNLKVLIYTSGVLSDNEGLKPIHSDLISKLSDNIRFIINIQASTPQLFERINRVPGSFKIINNSLDNIATTNLELEAHVVPFKYNYEKLEEIYYFCKRKNFDKISFLRFVPQGRGNREELYNNKEEFHQVVKSLKKILELNKNDNIDVRLGHPINFLFLLDSEDLYHEDTHYCRGGYEAPLILPNGDVSMCPAWKDLNMFIAGNIYESSFEEIWKSEYFQLFRDFIVDGYKDIDEPCQSCEYLEGCRGKCIAQRLLDQEINENTELSDVIYHAPDPQCFKGELESTGRG